MQLFFLCAALVIVLDQFTKQLAITHLMPNEESLVLIAEWLKLTYTENTGIAFGLSLGSPIILICCFFEKP